jgi:hypothetical protein
MVRFRGKHFIEVLVFCNLQAWIYESVTKHNLEGVTKKFKVFMFCSQGSLTECQLDSICNCLYRFFLCLLSFLYIWHHWLYSSLLQIFLQIDKSIMCWCLFVQTIMCSSIQTRTGKFLVVGSQYWPPMSYQNNLISQCTALRSSLYALIIYFLHVLTCRQFLWSSK